MTWQTEGLCVIEKAGQRWVHTPQGALCSSEAVVRGVNHTILLCVQDDNSTAPVHWEALCHLQRPQLYRHAYNVNTWQFCLWTIHKTSKHTKDFPKYIPLYKSKFMLNSNAMGIYMWPWNTKPVLSRWSIFVAIAKNTLYGSKLWIFMAKNFRTLSEDHVPWRYFVNVLL